VNEFDEELKELKRKGLLRRTVALDSPQGPGITINGELFINFSSNDYLNLSTHPEIIRASAAALKKYGSGSGASRLLSGTQALHVSLEKKIAAYKGSRSALLFNTGYAANTGIISALAGKHSVIFSDALNHASIIDGIKLSGARVKIFRHRDPAHLEVLLKKHVSSRNRKLIITDTVFSMDGDVAPLKDILSLSRKYDARLMIDDAHATGVLGRSGRGGLEHFGIRSGDIIQMGTLSKAAGCFGGFVAGRKGLVTLLMNRARSFIYSTSLPPADVGAAIKAIDILADSSEGLRKRLWKNRERLRRGLQKAGFDTLGSETPIVPLLIGDVKKTMHVAGHLLKNNIYAPAIRPPTVPEGKCRIRLSVTAGHTYEEIDRVLACLKESG
jgi:8-amino-7-oxononanoate synthase